jgi:hypothetical protein
MKNDISPFLTPSYWNRFFITTDITIIFSINYVGYCKGQQDYKNKISIKSDLIVKDMKRKRKCSENDIFILTNLSKAFTWIDYNEKEHEDNDIGPANDEPTIANIFKTKRELTIKEKYDLMNWSKSLTRKKIEYPIIRPRYLKIKRREKKNMWLIYISLKWKDRNESQVLRIGSKLTDNLKIIDIIFYDKEYKIKIKNIKKNKITVIKIKDVYFTEE